MAYRILLAPRVRRDVDEILGFIAGDSPSAARQWPPSSSHPHLHHDRNAWHVFRVKFPHTACLAGMRHRLGLVGGDVEGGIRAAW